MSDISRRDTPLFDGNRRDARRFLRIDRRGRIAHDEYFGVAFQLELRIHHCSTDAIVRPWQ